MTFRTSVACYPQKIKGSCSRTWRTFCHCRGLVLDLASWHKIDDTWNPMGLDFWIPYIAISKNFPVGSPRDVSEISSPWDCLIRMLNLKEGVITMSNGSTRKNYDFSLCDFLCRTSHIDTEKSETDKHILKWTENLYLVPPGVAPVNKDTWFVPTSNAPEYQMHPRNWEPGRRTNFTN